MVEHIIEIMLNIEMVGEYCITQQCQSDRWPAKPFCLLWIMANNVNWNKRVLVKLILERTFKFAADVRRPSKVCHC